MPNATSTDSPIVITITPAIKAAIIAKIAELAALINFTVGLSNDQRKKLLKLGVKTVGWDEKAANYMANRPDLVPGYVDMDAFAKNRAVRVDLGDILRVLDGVRDPLVDTIMVVGHQVYKPELAFYNSAQEATKHGVPDTQNIVDDLKEFFAKTTPATTPPPTSPTP